ncbi:MAG: peptidase M64 [Chloroflexia bacterium]|nr:peptidase M64 [Chloroflexia bacterium]
MKKRMIYLFAFAFLLFSCNKENSTENKNPEKATEKSFSQTVNNGNVDFEKYFEDKTMRFDYFHTGTSNEEHFAPDKFLSDGIWPGSKTKLIDELELGLYFYEILDSESNTLLYSRGFASIFGEWQTIPEAAEQWGTFHESIRFPWPKKPVKILMKKRDSLNVFQTIWETSIDPASRKANPADIVHSNNIYTIQENGPASEKVDILILGDGYTSEEMSKFRADAKRLAGNLMDAEPYKSRQTDINIRAIETPSAVSGVNRPHPGIFKRTTLQTHYSSFDSERYVLAYENKLIRDIASQVPYDILVIVVNEKTYGGGGIYNLYGTVSADNKFSNYIMVHELGHSIAALADEYYTSAVSYEVSDKVTVEPWELNVTALMDKENLKWKHLVEEGTPIPTPWNKEEFDKFGYEIQKERSELRAKKVPESEVEALFERQHKQETEYFEKEKYKDKVGAFEGASYMQKACTVLR